MLHCHFTLFILCYNGFKPRDYIIVYLVDHIAFKPETKNFPVFFCYPSSVVFVDGRVDMVTVSNHRLKSRASGLINWLHYQLISDWKIRLFEFEKYCEWVTTQFGHCLIASICAVNSKKRSLASKQSNLSLIFIAWVAQCLFTPMIHRMDTKLNTDYFSLFH